MGGWVGRVGGGDCEGIGNSGEVGSKSLRAGKERRVFWERY